jgi:hypothetical protein
MKTSLFATLATLALSSALADGDLAAAVTLRDSSVIKGTVAETTVFEGSVAFTDGVKLPIAMIREMTADGTGGVQIATLANGDKFHFTPTTKALSVATVLGDLSISLSNIRRVAFSASPGSSADGLIYYCTFDSPEAILKPVVGPAGKFLSGRFVDGKAGSALAVRAYSSGAYIQLPPNTIGQKGCFEFWAKFTPPAERIGVGQWPCFFTCGVLGAEPRFCLEWNANNGTGGGGVNAMLEHLRACTSGYGASHSYFEILGNAMTEWHHYALVWNKDGIPSLSSGASLPIKAAIFLDGRPIARESFRNVPNWKLSPSITGPATFLSFPTHPEDGVQNRVDYVIDEFKFWNYDRTDFGM